MKNEKPLNVARNLGASCLKLAVISIAATSLPLTAQVITWDAEGDGSTWLEAANWTGDEIPDTITESAVIGDVLGTPSVVLLKPVNGTTLDIDELTIDAGNTLNVRFDSGTFNVTGGLSNSGILSHTSSPSSNSRTVHLNIGGTNQIFNTATGTIDLGGNSGRNRINQIMTLDAQNQNDGVIDASLTSSADRDTIRFRLENSGTFTNNGSITIRDTQSSTSSYSELQLLTAAAAVTLGGTGSVTLDVGTLADSARARIRGNGSGQLTNGLNHTILGGGLVGSNVDVVNNGLMQATSDTATLRIDPDSTFTNNASGRLVAIDIAGLEIGSGSIAFVNDGHLESRTGSNVEIKTSNATLNGVIAGSGNFSAGLAVSGLASISPGDFLNADGTGGSTIGTMNVNLNLSLEDTTILSMQLGSDGAAGIDYDSISVAGSLLLDGVLDITEEAGFGAGTYRLATFNSGELTDNGLELGSVPSGYDYVFDANSAGGFLDLNVSVVPEPSTYALLLGVCVVGFVSIRRRLGKR